MELLIAGPVYIQANKPIQVAHVSNGWTYDNSASEEGDPCEILLPPAGGYLMTNIVFALTNDCTADSANNGDFDQNWINIIVSQSAIPDTKLDGSAVGLSFSPIRNGYFGAQVPVQPGTHTVTSSQPVGVEAYGWGYTDAYGYCGGMTR